MSSVLPYRTSPQRVIEILKEVSYPEFTQWSIVFDTEMGEARYVWKAGFDAQSTCSASIIRQYSGAMGCVQALESIKNSAIEKFFVKIFAQSIQKPYLCHAKAQMAELVDALVSNTSGFTSMPVRSRLWVLKALKS